MSLLDEIRQTNYLIWHHHTHQVGAPILQAKNVCVEFNAGVALEEVSFELITGERLAIVGPNGAGKSTLFKVIAGVLTPSRGQVHIYGHEPGGHICIAYVPQRNQVDWSFPVNVADVVMMGRIGKLGLFRQPKASDWDIVRESLEVVGLDDLEKRQVGELSGGQQQRMFIARALAQEAELMLMDEPLAGLDIQSQEDILQILEQLHQREVTMLVALHDLKIARERFDRVMLLNKRLLGLGTPREVFQPDILLQAYGGHMHVIDTEQGIIAYDDSCCDEGSGS